MRYLSFIVIIIAATLSCKEDDIDPNIILPINLQVMIEVSQTTIGLVAVVAEADNANYYSFEFVEGASAEFLTSNDGTATHQFTKSGNHKILVKAHTSFEHYIMDEFSVNITIEDPGNGNNGGIPTTGYSSPLNYPGYNLVWNDEFSGTSLSSNWIFEIGTGNNGWGNNELQYYRQENTEVRDGYLIITAKQEVFAGSSYTSSRIITRGLKKFKYGRIDIRAALPQGQGLWPALWMLGESYSSVGWPACGEIDIMEMVGGTGNGRGDDHVFGTAHWDNNGSRAQYGKSNKLSSGIYANEFHVFSIEWDSNSIKWFRDDIKYNELTISSSGLAEFRKEFFFIMNVAVGGNWPGSPNSSTQFPQQMAVDYIRVFQN